MYAEASALETLLGFYYFSDRERLEAFLKHLDELGAAPPSPVDDTPPTWDPSGEVGESVMEGAGGDTASAGKSKS